MFSLHNDFDNEIAGLLIF